MSAYLRCPVPEIDALILFPSLGAPQILPPGPDECTLIIATNAKGNNELRDNCKGAVLVNHHLRLIKLNADKTNLLGNPGPVESRLYKAIREEYYFHDEENTKSNGAMLRKQYIEINELILEEGNLLCWPLKKEDGFPVEETHGRPIRKVIGRLSQEARALYGRESFDYYFAITLKDIKNSCEAQLSRVPMSWAWIVTSNAAAGHRFTDSNGKNLPMPTYHQPLDRLIHNKFAQLAKDPSVNGSLMETDLLYEIPVKDGAYRPPREGVPYLRVQAWHPVLTRKDSQPLKLGHLTDTHISVRAATIAKSPARVIEDSRAGHHYEKVGSRLAHTYKSFKALIDEMVVQKADVLAITGDAIDFNRNLDPQHIKQDEPTTGEVWGALNVIANVRKEKGGYRRGVDQLYLYSLFMYALRDLQVATYYITGNHEGYQWPYGISPRLNKDLKSAAKTLAGSEANYTVALNKPTEADREANEAVRLAEERLLNAESRLRKACDESGAAAGQANAGEFLKKQRDAEYEVLVCQGNLENAQERAEQSARELEDLTNKNIERASDYHQDKANEGIPLDHNLTIYEACLAYGPTYGQLISVHNFRREQFDWVHWLYAPFSDLNVYPCCTDPLGQGAKQVITLLGWGKDERLHADMLYIVSDNKKGADRRSFGFLPYATDSINGTQLALIEKASQVKTDASTRWSVLTHFTIANFRDFVPINAPLAQTGFVTDKDEPAMSLVTVGDTNAQYNAFNWGGCEKGLLTFLSTYVGLAAKPGAGQVDLHISGHSHRCGVYTLRPRKVPTNKEVSIGIECRVPQFPHFGGLPSPEAGTHFVVGSTAGPMGKQAVSGWRLNGGGWTDNEPSEAGDSKWNPLLGGWVMRPPSGLVIDTGTNKLQYVKAPGHEKRNDLPRLSVMVDYRDLMSISEGTPVYRPIILCPAQGELLVPPAHTRHLTTFDTGLPVKLSSEILALDCLDLKKIRVWVYKPGGPASEKDQSSDGDKPGTPTANAAAQGGWDFCNAWLESLAASPSLYKLCLENNGKTIRDAFTPRIAGEGKIYKNRDVILCSFVEIPLKEPAKNANVPWDEVKWEGESWLFPVDITRSRYLTTTEIIRRGWGESGEIPKWEFLEKHLKYPNAKKTINPPKDSSGSTQNS